MKEGYDEEEEDDESDSDMDDTKKNINEDNLQLNLRRFKIFSFN